ncbi:hypothetical protein INR49_022693 [Caranx melampygus]|nr:hypothetical protein INR49_022693 [Caranx melampygus]
MRRDIRVLRSATKELMCCEELHAVLHLVLQAGNILNAGGYAGNAVGFKLSSLLSLADTKANKPGMNLLHFVALKLSHVQAAARISLESLDAELQWLMTRTRSVEENVQRDTELLQQLDDFLQSATSSLCSLRGSRQQLKKEGSELIDFFCEDRDTFRLDECFSIFQTFCSRFTDAVKENMEREAKEAARRRRLQELEEQKRHSWAGGEEVGGSFRLRCSSEADMSAAMTRHDEAGLLMELLTPKSHPRSPQSNSALGRSGSLRRSRNSPSSSPSLAAERDLNTLLEMSTPDHKVGLQRGGGGGGGGETRTGFRSVSPALRSPGLSPHSPLTQTLPQSPRVRTFTFPQNQQPQPGEIVPQTPSSPPKTSWSPKKAKAYLQTTTYLGSDAHQTPDVTVKPTSDSNQQSDHNNNGDDRLGCETALSDHQTQSGLKEEPTRTNKADKGDGRVDHNTTGKVSVVLETRTLVPELKVFDTVATPTSHSEEHHSSRSAGRHQDDLVITDLEEEEDDNARVQTVQNKPQVANVEKSDAQRDEEEAQEDPVIVWCVTGVCEAAGELTHTDSTHVRTDKDQCRSDSQGGNQPSSSGTANRTLSEPQPANEKPVPVPISSQPVPVSRSDDPSRQVSSPGWRPAEPASASKAPALTIDACEEGREPADQREEAADSTHDPRGPTVPKQPQDVKRKNKASSCITTNKNSTAGKTEPAPASKPPTKNTLTSKTRPAGVKPSTPPSTTSTTNKSRPVRTLTTSEKEAMRRVVPISRTNRPDKPPVRGSSSTAAPNSLTVPNPYSATFRRVERLSTPPSSRRSSVHKSQDPKDSKDQKTSGTQASAREQTQDLARKPSIRKPVAKPKPPQEEKICRSTLRALSQAGQGARRRRRQHQRPCHPFAQSLYTFIISISRFCPKHRLFLLQTDQRHTCSSSSFIPHWLRLLP